MRPGRIVALVIGCLLALPAVGILVGGAILGLGYGFARDADGFFDADIDLIESETAAVTAEDLTFASEPGSPDWILDWLDADVRLRATNADASTDVFVGIARERDVDAYLAGVAHDEIVELDGLDPEYRRRSGTADVEPPTEQDFWVESATGPGTAELIWEADSGRWAAVLMNADGSPGVEADVNAAVRVGFVLALALGMLGLGVFLTALAVTLIVVGATGPRDEAVAPAAVDAGGFAVRSTPVLARPHPVALEAELDPDVSRWQWLVKWFLAIPHFIVLAFLYVAFVVLTVAAGIAILFTGRYPRGLFDFNVGVLRWTWRVSYYATTGGLGTDRYPAFSLGHESSDLATLEIEYPERLSRGLVLVKWWLLAIPHYLVLGLLLGSFGWFGADLPPFGFPIAAGGGLLGLLVVVAAVILLFSDEYPRSLFDLIIGFNRWIFRVVAYSALMTDTYPPFRLDQGGAEPGSETGPPSAPPGGAASEAIDIDIDLRTRPQLEEDMHL